MDTATRNVGSVGVVIVVVEAVVFDVDTDLVGNGVA